MAKTNTQRGYIVTVQRASLTKADLDDTNYEIKILRGKVDIAMRKLRVVLGKKPKAEVVKLFAELNDMGADERRS